MPAQQTLTRTPCAAACAPRLHLLLVGDVAWTKRARSPSSLASASPFSAFTSAIVTSAPRSCSARTVASPSPDAPPATIAACPSIRTARKPTVAVVKLSPMAKLSVGEAPGCLGLHVMLNAGDAFPDLHVGVSRRARSTLRGTMAAGCPSWWRSCATSGDRSAVSTSSSWARPTRTSAKRGQVVARLPVPGRADRNFCRRRGVPFITASGTRSASSTTRSGWSGDPRGSTWARSS